MLRPGLPIHTEKQVEMPVIRRKDMIGMYFHKVMQTACKFIIFPYFKQPGVRFENMKMCIHAFWLVGVFFTQTEILKWLPFTRKGFDISVEFCIKSILFNITKEIRCKQNWILIARSYIIFGKGIYGKSLGIYLFTAIIHTAIGIYRPVNTSILLIHKICGEIAECFTCIFEINSPAGFIVSSRKSP